MLTNRFAFAARLLVISTIPVFSLWSASKAYDYKVVAKGGEVIDGIVLNELAAPFIADDGTVLFIGDDALGQTATALFSKHLTSKKGSVLIKEGDYINGYGFFQDQIESAQQNDSGEVVFQTYNSGLFRLKTKVVALGDTVGGVSVRPFTFGGFGFNDSGEIVFGAEFQAPDGTFVNGIFTPHRLIVASGETIAGLTLTNVGAPSLSKSGVIAFNASFTSSDNQYVNGIFTQHALVVKTGDTVDGLTLYQLSTPAIGELGAIGYVASFGEFAIAYIVNNSVIAKTGDTIDGLTLIAPGDPLAPLGSLSLNAAGEALFASNATDSNGNQTGGWFTGTHSVVALGDTIAGFTVTYVYGASINDSGQIAFIASSATAGSLVIVATPK